MKKKYMQVVSMFLLLTLLCTGCGGASEDSSKDKDTLTVAVSADPPTLDPHSASLAHTVNALNPVYETLVRYTEDGELIPLLAESWEQLDELSWKFNLRKGVKFHNGEEMKSSDVLYSFQRATGSDGALVSHITYILDAQNSEAVDDYTVIIRTKEPFAPFLQYLSHMACAVVSEKEFTENTEKASQNPCGTGPFKFQEWKKNDRVTYVKNEDYWGEKAKYSNLVIRTIVEANSRVIELESGSIDIAYEIPANDVTRIKGNKELKIADRPSTTYEYFGMNTSKEPFNNPEFRMAIDLAIDEEELVKSVYKETAIYTPGPVTPDMKYFDDSDVECRYDPAKAKEILNQLGIKDGTKFRLTTFEAKHRVDSATILQSMLNEVGIELEIESLELAAWSNKLGQGDTDFFIAGFGAVGFSDPDMNVYGPLHSNNIGLNNYCFYQNEELDNMIDSTRKISDGEEREALFKDIQKLIRKEVPMIPYANTMQVVGLRKNVQGFKVSPAQNHFVNNVYFGEK